MSELDSENTFLKREKYKKVLNYSEKGIGSENSAVYPNQKTQKGILTGKTRCIPKSKGKKGYIDGKNSLYTQIKRRERVY